MHYQELSNENIASCVEETGSYYKRHKIDKKTVLKNKLAVEDILLDLQNHFGASAAYSISSFRRLGMHHTIISVKGPSFNPLDLSDDEDESSFNNLMARMGLAPSYKYEHGRNIIDIKTERHKWSTVSVLLVTLAASLLLGLAAKRHPSAFATYLEEHIISPIADSFSGFLGAISGPVIFFTIISAIINIGDLSSIKQFGSQVLKKIFIFSLATFILGIIPLLAITAVTTTGAEASPLNLMLATLFSVIPSNLIQPFIDNNVLQVLFWGVVIAMALIAVNNQDSVLATTLSTLNDVFSELMKSITTLTPVFIFTSIFLIISTGSINLMSAGILILYQLLCLGTGFILMAIFTWIRSGISPAKVFKYSYKALLTGILTCSSMLVLNQTMDDLADEKKYNVDIKTVKFVTPIGQILFKPFNSLNLVGILIGVMKISDTPITISMMFTMILLSFVFGVAVPSCAGGGLAVMAVMFNTLNLDMSYLALALSMDTLLDYFTTPMNAYSIIPCVLFCQDKKKITQ